MSNYHIKHLEEYFQVYRKSINHPEKFWEEIAEENFVWRKKWDSVLEWDFEKPDIKWFQGAKLNITENCIDRHLLTRGEKTALLFEPNDPNEPAEHITYKQLAVRVNKFANVLKTKGIQKGDRVCIYLPMILNCLLQFWHVLELVPFILKCLRDFRLQHWRQELMIPIAKWSLLQMVLFEGIKLSI